VSDPRDSLLDDLLRERPHFHRGETETLGATAPRASTLDDTTLARLRAGQPACYGVDDTLARWIHATTHPAHVTLEVGAGISTIAFALRAARHVAITPHQTEVDAIHGWGAGAGLALDHVRFVVDDSTRYLPRCDDGPFDVVLIDGKHAFPWPIVDWFYATALLRPHGLVLIDDLSLRAPALLDEFMAGDPAWTCVEQVGQRAVAYRKSDEAAHDVPWHMQPFTRGAGRRPAPSRLGTWLQRLGLRRGLRRGPR
jgi:predicted O-methyltransferase YrrM